MKIELSGTNTAWWPLSHPVTNDYMTSKLTTKEKRRKGENYIWKSLTPNWSKN